MENKFQYSPIVICGFPGIGKSRVAHDRLSISDSDSSEFSWMWDKENPMMRVRNPEFPQNYGARIEKFVTGFEYEYILVSSHQVVRDDLKYRGIRYIVVAPRRCLKSEYLARYLKRGSTMDFIETLNEKWDEFIDGIENEDAPVIWLEAGQYLSDVIGV